MRFWQKKLQITILAKRNPCNKWQNASSNAEHIKYMNLKEKTISMKNIYKGKLISLAKLEVSLPDGTKGKREIVSHPGAVAIVALLPNKKIIFVRQYRKAVEKILLEIPAGTLNKGEAPNNCAKRELAEETGFKAKHLKKLVVFYPTPGYGKEKIHIYKATDLVKIKNNTRLSDPDEFLDVKILSISQVKKLIKSGKIKDGKTLIGLNYII